MIRLSKQRGVAIALVLWLLSGLMVLSAAITGSARNQGSLATQQNHEAVAQSLGEGATNIALKELMKRRLLGEAPAGTLEFEYHLADTSVRVRATQANGFINLNTASDALLTSLFINGAELSPEDALVLAHRIVDWRDSDQTPLPFGAEDKDYIAAGRLEGARDGEFRVTEDLRQVLGVTPSIFVRIKNFVTTYPSSSVGVNPQAAPEAILRILAEGNEAVVQDILESRQAAPSSSISSGKLIEVNESNVSIVLLEAWIEHPDGGISRYARWVDTLAASPSGLPWMTLRVEPIQHLHN